MLLPNYSAIITQAFLQAQNITWANVPRNINYQQGEYPRSHVPLHDRRCFYLKLKSNLWNLGDLVLTSWIVTLFISMALGIRDSLSLQYKTKATLNKILCKAVRNSPLRIFLPDCGFVGLH